MNANEPYVGRTAARAAILAVLLLWAPLLPAQEPMADPSALDEDDEAWARESAAESAVPPQPPSATIQPAEEGRSAQATAPATSHPDEEDDAAAGRDPCGRHELPDEVPAPDPSALGEEDDMPVEIPGPDPSALGEDDDPPPD